jgi:hypothetical protein
MPGKMQFIRAADQNRLKRLGIIQNKGQLKVEDARVEGDRLRLAL